MAVMSSRTKLGNQREAKVQDGDHVRSTSCVALRGARGAARDLPGFEVSITCLRAMTARWRLRAAIVRWNRGSSLSPRLAGV
jgi:hypothetical protein